MEAHDKTLSLEQPNPFIAGAILLLAIAGMFFAFNGKAADDVMSGKVTAIISEGTATIEFGDEDKTIKEQELRIEARTVGGRVEEYAVLNDFAPVREGDTIFFRPSAVDESRFNVVDISRTPYILMLTAFFVFLVIATSGRKGFYALIALVWSFAVVFSYIVPRILAGSNPILTGVCGAAIILAPALYLSYGLNRKSAAAFLGIIIALAFTGFLANVSVSAARLSGLSEASVYLNMESGSEINLVGLLIAGIIIAAVGVLDDVAAVQSSTVFALASVDRDLRGFRLFRKAMAVGKDHISAVVNTLVLAYTGAALPLILLFSARGMSPDYFVSIEIVAEEIIRTLVASSGLLLAVPLATAIAAAMAGKPFGKK